MNASKVADFLILVNVKMPAHFWLPRLSTANLDSSADAPASAENPAFLSLRPFFLSPRDHNDLFLCDPTGFVTPCPCAAIHLVTRWTRALIHVDKIKCVQGISWLHLTSICIEVYTCVVVDMAAWYTRCSGGMPQILGMG